jgi:hypothetical protein
MSTPNTTTHAIDRQDVIRREDAAMPETEPAEENGIKLPKRKREEHEDQAGRTEKEVSQPFKKTKIIVDTNDDDIHSDNDDDYFNKRAEFPKFTEGDRVIFREDKDANAKFKYDKNEDVHTVDHHVKYDPADDEHYYEIKDYVGNVYKVAERFLEPYNEREQTKVGPLIPKETFLEEPEEDHIRVENDKERIYLVFENDIPLQYAAVVLKESLSQSVKVFMKQGDITNQCLGIFREGDNLDNM